VLVLGCDPGIRGSLALVDTDACQVIDCLDMPTVPFNSITVVDGRALAAWLAGISYDFAVVELVNAMPEWGKGQCMHLGRVAGGLEAVLMTTGLPIVHCTPVAWKRRAGLLKRDKAASLALARARLSWPKGTLELAKHHGRAEAGLIALFGRAPERAAPKPKRSKMVDDLAARNVPPGPLFGGARP
jgi:crossover junction endodeoxyribonuclease RuvC